MPWFIDERDDEFCVVKGTRENPIEDVACHDTKKEASAQMGALYASEGKKAISLDQQQEDVYQAWRDQFPGDDAVIESYPGGYVRETYPDHAIVNTEGSFWHIPYTRNAEGEIIFADRSEWQEVEEKREWMAKAGNALKAVSKTDNELRVGNYLVVFGGRDLEGVANDNTNPDGTSGEFFTKSTVFDSPYTSTGRLLIDWEHGQGKIVDGTGAPGPDDVFGFVDWKTAQIDEAGVWVERVLNRRSKYMQWLETLIDAGLIGSSSGAIGEQVEKKATGEIVKWPLRRDTFTVAPMEPRMMTENVIQAAKALGIQIEPNEPKPEAQPEADATALAVEAAKVKAAQKQLELSLLLMEAT